MINSKIIDLQNQFKNLEIHAAKSGRLVLEILVHCIIESSKTSFQTLYNEVIENCEALLEVIPPYAPPLNSMNRVLLTLENNGLKYKDLGILKTNISQLIPTNDIQISHELIVKNLLPVLTSELTIFTHTLSETITGVLILLKRLIPELRVIVTESRPNNDGWITANKLSEAGIDTEICIDMCFPSAIDQSNLVVSGTEIINPDGSAVCKIGIYPIAQYCKKTNKPFFLIADTNKICPIHSKYLGSIPITLEDIGINDSTKIKPFGDFFDTTSSELITGYVTEEKLFSIEDIKFLISNISISSWLKQRLMT